MRIAYNGLVIVLALVLAGAGLIELLHMALALINQVIQWDIRRLERKLEELN